MKIGSYNIRGLGSSIKKEEISSFFFNNKLVFCCVQETKLEAFSEDVGRNIWNKLKVGWCAENASGRAGGILSFWDESRFISSSQWCLGGAVVVSGRWKATGEEYCVINVYAPCSSVEKEMLWDRLLLVVDQNVGVHLCIIGDFNAILEEGERVGIRCHNSARERQSFREFVTKGNLMDIKLHGRRFTWFKPNGKCKSRIDRAIINEKWGERWLNSSLRGLKRSVSDHCPIVLETKEEDWGPKPFRFINAWLSHSQFMEVVKESWEEGGVIGWGSFVFMEKLKRLKARLKVWNLESFGLLDKEIDSLRHEIHALDMVDEAIGLTEEEAYKRNASSARLMLLIKNKKSLLAQKAKMNWLKDGDFNSRLFHRAIKSRRAKMGLLG